MGSSGKILEKIICRRCKMNESAKEMVRLWGRNSSCVRCVDMLEERLKGRRCVDITEEG